jgi:hypothetical protein
MHFDIYLDLFVHVKQLLSFVSHFRMHVGAEVFFFSPLDLCFDEK